VSESAPLFVIHVITDSVNSRSPNRLTPIWLTYLIEHSPVVFLGCSVLCFLSGLLLFGWSSNQALPTIVMASLLSASVSVSLVSVAVWLVVTGYNGQKWFQIAVSEVVNLAVGLHACARSVMGALAHVNRGRAGQNIEAAPRQSWRIPSHELLTPSIQGCDTEDPTLHSPHEVLYYPLPLPVQHEHEDHARVDSPAPHAGPVFESPAGILVLAKADELVSTTFNTRFPWIMETWLSSDCKTLVTRLQ
jgi:hypothetical protein